MEPAEDDGHAAGPEAARERVRGVDPGREARNPDEIELRKRLEALEIVDFEVADLVTRRREPCHREQAQARQRRDDPTPADEARERHAQGGELRRPHAHSAHRDQPDPHGTISSPDSEFLPGKPAASMQVAIVSAATGAGSR